MALSKLTSNSFSSTANTSIDNGTFTVDVTNNRIGINRANPNAGLEVANSGWRLATYSGTGTYDGGLGGGFNASNNIYSMYARDRTDTNWNTLWIEANTISLKSGNSSYTAISCDSSGRVLMAYQPKFFAYRSSTGNQTTEHTIPFDTTDVNIGSHFSTSTYRFTAPVAGTYYFATEGMNHQSASSVGYTTIKLLVNGSQYGYFHIVNNHPSSCSKDYIITLAAGDYVTMSGNNYHWNGTQYRYPSFAGYLMG